MQPFDIEISLASDSFPADHELSGLLYQVYVEGGYTDRKVATSMFQAQSVRERGSLVVARLRQENMLIGMAILVPPTSAAKKLADPDEVELHLLAVSPDYRGRGIGRRLVESTIARAKTAGLSRMLLWSQPSMKAAHQLYYSTQFERLVERDFYRDGQEFWVFQRTL